GYVYIAKPPLYRLTRGQKHRYIERESELEEILLGDKFDKLEITDRNGTAFKLTEARWKRFTRLLKQYEGWASALRAAHGHGVVAFMQQARMLEEQIGDVRALLAHIAAAGTNGNGGADGGAYQLELVQEHPDELVVRTIEARTGLATTHRVRHSALDANEYQRLADVHRDLAALTGEPPFVVRLGETEHVTATFEELHDGVLAIAQKGIDYYRFKGLGEMDADELRETTMDPETRTLVQVTMEDAASADLVFSMLMGDAVEPRRQFIEENARLATLDT
ncbi:MAG: DNA gyrase subunit B, partial [Solirubrobacteraceae bacterium]